jgi:hypothetical protein
MTGTFRSREQERSNAIQALLLVVMAVSHLWDKRAPFLLFGGYLACWYGAWYFYKHMEQDLGLKKQPSQREAEDAEINGSNTYADVGMVEKGEPAVHEGTMVAGLLPICGMSAEEWLPAELVQNIISYLDFKDVCHTQALNSVWLASFVSDSTHTQVWKALYQHNFGIADLKASKSIYR